MTTAELHEILDNPNKHLTPVEMKEVIYKLKLDAFHEAEKYHEAKVIAELNHDMSQHQALALFNYYVGESNAFQICLDLLEHLVE